MIDQAKAMKTLSRAEKRMGIIWRSVRVPLGAELRLLVAAMSLSVGLPRLPYLNLFFEYDILSILRAEYFGVLFTALGIALLITCYTGRLTLSSRIVALFGLTLWSMLMFVGTSATGRLIDLSVAAALFYEASTIGTANNS